MEWDWLSWCDVSNPISFLLLNMYIISYQVRAVSCLSLRRRRRRRRRRRKIICIKKLVWWDEIGCHDVMSVTWSPSCCWTCTSFLIKLGLFPACLSAMQNLCLPTIHFVEKSNFADLKLTNGPSFPYLWYPLFHCRTFKKY